MAPSRRAGPAVAASVIPEQARHQPGHGLAGFFRQLLPGQPRRRAQRFRQAEEVELPGRRLPAG
jgi:hypothetical protein